MKKWYQSKTIRLAILQAIASILTAFMAQGILQDVGFLMIVKSILDILIRLNTDTPIA